jgi:hypothetical protein
MSEDAKKEPRVVVTVRMTRAGKAAIVAMAAELGMKDGHSEFIRIACQEKLAKHRKQTGQTP